MALTPLAARPAATILDALLRRLPLAGAPDAVFEVGVALARLLRWVDRRTDERIDVSRAGRALLVAEPRAIARLARRLPDGAVAITGTNGKTTTTNLLADLLEAEGRRPVANRIGANMAGGIAAELIAAARLGGRIDAGIGVFEVDELWLDRVLPDLQPRVLVLTNLFRDQLDRMGEVDQVADRWEPLIAALDPPPVLVVCADDPRLDVVADEADRVVRFGMPATDPVAPDASDLPDCRRCGSPLDVVAHHIGHLGDWRCPACGAARQDPDVGAESWEVPGIEGGRFVLVDRSDGREVRTPVQLHVPGRANLANALAAAAAARVLDVPVSVVVEGLGGARAAFGRSERLQVGGQLVTLLLAKNPVGFDEVTSMLAERRPLDLLVMLNDRDIDGRDPSWIWDADLESLVDATRTVTCSGTRGADLAMRLDYAGADFDTIELVSDISSALDRAIERAEGEVVAIANYTAMLELRELVAERGFAARYWW